MDTMVATNIRKGSAIIFNGEVNIVSDFKHGTPGKGRGFVQATMRAVKTGKVTQYKFASDEQVERAFLEPKNCQFLYSDDTGFHFMDMDSYESFCLNEAMLGDKKYFLIENMELKIQFYKNDPIAPELPKIVILALTESPPWIRGDSVSNNMKPAVCETGLKIQVPIFLEEGEKIKVNTDSGEYLGRA